MTIKVNAEGLVIPRELLDGVEEFEVHRRDGSGLIVVPIGGVELEPHGIEEPSEARSIFELLGSDPIDDGPADASEQHDLYLYGDPHGDRLACE